jgi:hypothetical protein
LDAVDRSESHALQLDSQSMLDDNLHHLQGNRQRQMDSRLCSLAGGDGICRLFFCCASVALVDISESLDDNLKFYLKRM